MAATLDTSFAPDGRWFVFRTDTGKTVKRGLQSKGAAIRWIHAPANRQPNKPEKTP